ncbi:MAG: folylpolyglutamate synthase/dihydrofolate synthase family protein [Vicinamibacterales bacterium]|jgi:dihydrofolate synthase/folylpolyglutamate synthase|nr:hypothetical protein [Acidobacteriota bacterium]MDP6372465.1 folylpolyglutamate synthase/dihydrofolate synthase family protein [Vicinamibacterales bacterium]MDP6608912.1 folylpolyglutamate synthase/dihydrofolate synthase family protein [Vicinamibacterales bacterium]HAK54263.1 bifunctional folylpolyglutamate synthase/dihydrofolate synthase [Acidobacteriota bacterium]|tara:strand:+ start:4368 stop:5699 length:1332 start_codon:yes stop_codon:yes gene_type:complete
MVDTDLQAYLRTLERFGIKLGLEPMRALCAALGHPEREFRSVVIAGTNGKGSVAAMTEAGLRAGGHRTGRYTSPHLVRLEERIAIDGEPITFDELHSAVLAVRTVVDRLCREHRLDASPTFFEVTTAAAFVAFSRARVDVAVLEVGLGGRFDATNVTTPVGVAITSIDLDHEAQLGRTIRGIALEKAGIIGRGSVAVVGDARRDVQELLADSCRRAGARYVDATQGVVLDVRCTSDATIVSLETPVRRYEEIRLALQGRHQARNALTAVRLLEGLAGQGLEAGAAAIASGLREAVWPGRLQWITLPAGRLLLDAAHNPAAAEAVAEYLAETHPSPIPLVLAAMRDKDVDGILGALLPQASLVVCTKLTSERALPASALADRVRARAPKTSVVIELEPSAAVHRALAHGDVACATGSIVLAGELLRTMPPSTDMTSASMSPHAG